MDRKQIETGSTRKLFVTEYHKYCDHLLKLDGESRRMRFGMAVDDQFIRNYADRLQDLKSIIYGHTVDGEVRAAAELRPLGRSVHGEAEAAFSVEENYQNSGIGTELLGRVIRAARNRSIHRIYMNCLAENRRMQAVARKYDAVLEFDQGDVVGRVAPSSAHYFSIWREAVEDEMGFVMAVLDLQRKFLPAA
ncbi:MAG: GNAT family N-acetyltransferase [Hyphomicrobiaceae bacterium]|nr:GNAT family N-acetyltransferase [Hyphomicrobiaceae bacterium]